MINDTCFEKLCERDVPLSNHSAYGIGGSAGYFAVPETLEELFYILKHCRKYGLEFLVFGHGSNILFPDTPQREKVFISLKQLIDFKVNDSSLFFSAGVPLSVLALVGAVAGESKFDFTFLLPGSLGAGIYINAKCYEDQISGIIQTVYYLDLAEKEFAIKSLKVEECEFAYKKSIFQRKPCVIVGADVTVSNLNEAVIEYSKGLLNRLRDHRANLSSLSAFYTFFSEEAANLPDIPHKFHKISRYRNDKRHFSYPSCGSVFKNDYSVGTPMGAIIDKLNLRGRQHGGAMISPYHGNIIINHNHAKSGDVIALIELVQAEVKKTYSFLPEPEVVIVEE